MSGTGSESSALHEFGRWRFDAGTGDLHDGSTTVRLEPQVARLLDYFLTRQDTLITRDELMAAVWDNRIVSDHAVNRCVSILRQKLSPNDKNACIETVVRRGFISHFPPPCEDAAPPQDSMPIDGHPQTKKRGEFGGLAIVVAVLMAIVLFGVFRMLDDTAGGASMPERTILQAFTDIW